MNNAWNWAWLAPALGVIGYLYYQVLSVVKEILTEIVKDEPEEEKDNGLESIFIKKRRIA